MTNKTLSILEKTPLASDYKGGQFLSYFGHPDGISLADLIQKNQKKYQAQLNSLIVSFYKNLSQHQKLGDLSWFWSTIISECSPLKDVYYIDILKSFAIVDLIEDKKITQVELRLRQGHLIDFYISLFKSLNIPCKNIIKKKEEKMLIAKHSIVASGLFSLVKFWRLRKRPPQTLTKTNTILVGSFPFFTIKNAQFNSNFFQNVLSLFNYNYNHLLLGSNQVKSQKKARNATDKLCEPPIHVSDYFTLSNWIKALLKTINFNLILSKISPHNIFSVNGVSYYPLLKNEWKTSCIYDHLNLLILESCFDLFFKHSKIKNCIYTQEFQPREFALLKSLKKHDIKSFALVHSQISNNYLSFQNLGFSESSFLLPDYILVNNTSFKKWWKTQDRISNKVIEVEAHRFAHLNKISDISAKPNSLLVLTSIIVEEAKFQLQLLSDLLKEPPRLQTITIKPHPAINIAPLINKYSNLKNCTLSTEPVETLLNQNEIIFCSPNSSTLIESVIKHKKTLTFFNLNLPNSRLIDHPNLKLIQAGEMNIKKFLEAPLSKVSQSHDDLLILDPSMKRWHQVIKRFEL